MEKMATIYFFRSKSCKKDLWTQINTALQAQANGKWQRPDLGIQSNFSYVNARSQTTESTEEATAAEVQAAPPTPPRIHLYNISATDIVTVGHPAIYLAQPHPQVATNEPQSGNSVWSPRFLDDSTPPISWFEYEQL